MTKTVEDFLGPVKELNDLTINNMQQIAAIQMQLIQQNTQISADSFKAATEIKDFESLQTYMQGQVELAQNLSEKAKADAEEIMKLGQDYADKVKHVVEKSMKGA